jgi:hypothetical protein
VEARPPGLTHLRMGKRWLHQDIALQSDGHKFVSNKTAPQKFLSIFFPAARGA